MKYENTKWKKEKVEELMKKHGYIFESSNGYYNDIYIEFFERKIRISITILKSTITLESFFVHSYWPGITSYKKLDYALKTYRDEIRSEICKEVSL